METSARRAATSPLKNGHSAKILVETPGSKGVSTRCPRVFQRAATPPIRLSKGEFNRRLVRAAVCQSAPISRVELGELTGLPLSALTNLCGELIASSYLRERTAAAPGENGLGRRRTLLEPDLESLGVAAVQYDRHSVDAAIVDLSGAVRWQNSYHGPFTDAARLSKGIVAAITDALDASPIKHKRLLAVGAADPGLVDRARGRTLRAANVPGWRNIAIGEMLRDVANLPVIVDRGDGFQALGEAAFGAGRGARSLLYVSLAREGIGGGVVENGRLVAGRDGAAGEIGHVNIGGDLPCGCGLKGCLEAHVNRARMTGQFRESLQSGAPAIGSRAAKETRQRKTTGCRGVFRCRIQYARPNSFAQLIKAAAAGDRAGRRIVADAARIVARAAGSAINLLNPECVVFGGYFAEAGQFFLEPLMEALPEFVIPEMARDLSLKLAALGETSAFAGVAAQVRAETFAYPVTGQEIAS